MAEGSANPGMEGDEAKDPGPSCPEADNSDGTANGTRTHTDLDSGAAMESGSSLRERATETPERTSGSEEVPRRVESRTSIASERSFHEESQEGKTDGRTEPPGEISTFEKVTEPPSQEATEEPVLSTEANSLPGVLGEVMRKSSTVSQLSREALDALAADARLQKPLRISVSMQTDASWLYDHYCKKQTDTEPPESAGEKISSENDIYAILSQDLGSLDILCDMEFKEDFMKLFQESLRTLSSVGPPTILAYRPESSRGHLQITLEKECSAVCEFCGSVLRDFPSFESLEKIAKYATLFCCQQCRDLHEFIVREKMRYVEEVKEIIDVKPHAAHGSEAERQKAKERARQRQQEWQMAKRFAYIATEKEVEIVPAVHMPEYNKQLKTISYCLSQEPPSSAGCTKIPLLAYREELSQEVTYSISCCDFTVAGGKLMKKQFLQQYYKNGIKFLTIFPDGTAQIFYPSGHLAIIVVRKKEDAGYVCIVHEDKAENAEIQAVFESSGKGTCYHPNGIVWINITIRGGHYSDSAGNKIKTWVWPNNLEKSNPSVSFKPVFASLNQNVGLRIVGQDKIAISFLAMGKQAKINVGTKVQPSADHHPWPKQVSKEDLLLFACRIKILEVFAKLYKCLDFPSGTRWMKMQPPSYLSKRALKLMYLCNEANVSTELTNAILSIINSLA